MSFVPISFTANTLIKSADVNTNFTNIQTQINQLPIANGGTGQTTATAAFDALSPLTTTGDLPYYNGTHNVRLGIGATGQYLRVSGGIPAWQASTTASLSVVSKTTTYTATSSDDVILCSSSAFTMTLPAASSNSGKVFYIKKTDSSLSNIITIARAGSDTIVDGTSGRTSTTLNTMDETITIISDGTATWYVLNRTYSALNTTFSMSIAGSTSNPTKANTTIIDAAYWYRMGRNMVIHYDYEHTTNTGAANGSGTYMFTLPSGATADTSVQAVTDGSVRTALKGFAQVCNSTIRFVGNAALYDSTHLAISGTYPAAGNGGNIYGSAFIGFTDTTTAISFEAIVPISGWN